VDSAAAVDAILAVYALRGEQRYEEAVSQASHAVQCARLAEHAGAAPALVVAALLHDLGHLVSTRRRAGDDRHEVVAARRLRDLYGPEVTGPIAGHVAAKRYLCAVDPTYRGRLSDASERSLVVQGGPMTAEEARRFEAGAQARDAVRLRRWDDEAKDTAAEVPPVAAYRDLLLAVLTPRAGAPDPVR
jgi:gamma-butyrobetaine dioxygenase